MNKILIIKNSLKEEISLACYSKQQLSSLHKLAMYNAFMFMLDKYPNEMTCFFFDKNYKINFQHKIFQSYISFIEEELPFSFRKNKNSNKITSILDKRLFIFDGISNFISIVKNNIVKNNTNEFYIGNRSALYSKPFFIGKLLDIKDLDSNQSIMSSVDEYSFSKIKFKDIKDNTKIEVSHLRVPPHYQMGGLVHLNRLRKKIFNKINNLYDI